MKKILLAAVLFLSPQFAFASERDEFLDAFRNTFSTDSALTGAYDISILTDNTERLSAHSDINGYTHLNGNFWATEDFSAEFDFPEITSGKVNISAFAQYLHDSNTLLTGITQMSGEFGEDEKAAGFFELAKIFAGNEFVFAFDELKKLGAPFERSADILFNSAEFSTNLMTVAIDSGALTIAETPEGYHLALNKDPKQWKPEAIALLLERLGVPEEFLTNLKSTDWETQKAFRDSIAESLQYIDASFDFGTEGRHLTSLSTKISVHFDHESFDFSHGEFSSTATPVTGTFSGTVSFVSPKTTFQKPELTPVSLVKIIGVFQNSLHRMSHRDAPSFGDFSFEEDGSSAQNSRPNISLSNGITRKRKTIIRY